MTELRSKRGGDAVNQIRMTAPRWLAEDGWVKMQHRVDYVNIHYVRNTVEVDDFKFKNLDNPNVMTTE